jgi:hypothetical protein
VVDGERPDWLSIHDQGGGQELDVDDVAVLASTSADRSDMLTGCHSPPELDRLGVQHARPRHEIVQILPHGLLSGVAEEAFRGRVPRGDPIAEVGEHDGRRANLEHRLEELDLPGKLFLDPRSRGSDPSWRAHVALPVAAFSASGDGNVQALPWLDFRAPQARGPTSASVA